jgi:hypothetical protein
MKKTKFNVVLGLAVCALLLSTAVIAKHPVERPFKIHGNATVILDFTSIVIDPVYGPFVPWDMTTSSEATHAGRSTEVGNGRLYLEAGFSEGSGCSTHANGEETHWDAFEISDTQQVTVTFTGGTGRFENASGGFTFEYTVTEEKWDGTVLTLTYSWTGTGTITY